MMMFLRPVRTGYAWTQPCARSPAQGSSCQLITRRSLPLSLCSAHLTSPHATHALVSPGHTVLTFSRKSTFFQFLSPQRNYSLFLEHPFSSPYLLGLCSGGTPTVKPWLTTSSDRVPLLFSWHPVPFLVPTHTSWACIYCMIMGTMRVFTRML